MGQFVCKFNEVMVIQKVRSRLLWEILILLDKVRTTLFKIFLVLGKVKTSIAMNKTLVKLVYFCFCYSSFRSLFHNQWIYLLF